MVKQKTHIQSPQTRLFLPTYLFDMIYHKFISKYRYLSIAQPVIASEHHNRLLQLVSICNLILVK